MTPRQLATEAENAYDYRSRDMLTRSLGQLVAMAAPPDLNRLTNEQLEQRRNNLLVQLAAVQDELKARGRTRNGFLAKGQLGADPDLESGD